MRRSDKEITNHQVLDDMMITARVCRIGMVCADGPYVVPVNFAYEDPFVYFHCAPTGRKIDALRADPRVCVEVDAPGEVVPGDAPCRWGMRYRSVIAFGEATFLEDADKKIHALNLIMKKYAGDRFSFDTDSVNAVCVVGIRLKALTGKQSI